MTDRGDFLSKVITPEEVARRITASSGVHMTERTVWEKAKRLGIAKKLGRSMFIHIDDIPRLLEMEPTAKDRDRQRADDWIGEQTKKKALKLIREQKAAKKARGEY